MDINTGDSPPVCQKPYTLPLKYYNWVQQEIETLETCWCYQKKHQPMGKSYCHSSQKIHTRQTPSQKNVY